MSHSAFETVDAYMASVLDRELMVATSADARLQVLTTSSKVARAMSKVALLDLLTAVRAGNAPRNLKEMEAFVALSRSKVHVYMSPRSGGTIYRRLKPDAASRDARPVVPMLTPGEVARELGVSPKTVANWCKQGVLPHEVLDSGHRRIPASALDAYREGQRRWQRVDDAVAAAGGSDQAPSLTQSAEVLSSRSRRSSAP